MARQENDYMAPNPGWATDTAVDPTEIELFRRQIESIREQTHGDWLCVISDDCSRPDRVAAIEAVLAGDPRFVLSRSERRLGFFRNFERALMLAPAGARYVAAVYGDQYVKRELIIHGSDEMLEWSPPWELARLEHFAEVEGALIFIAGDPNPDLFADLDGNVINVVANL